MINGVPPHFRKPPFGALCTTSSFGFILISRFAAARRKLPADANLGIGGGGRDAPKARGQANSGRARMAVMGH